METYEQSKWFGFSKTSKEMVAWNEVLFYFFQCEKGVNCEGSG